MGRRARLKVALKTSPEGLNTFRFSKGSLLPFIFIRERPDALYDGRYGKSGSFSFVEQHMSTVAERIREYLETQYIAAGKEEFNHYMFEVCEYLRGLER